MAELGIFSSCLQIAETSIKLKKLWSEIRDAPKDVQELVEEVIANAETFSNIRQLYQAPDQIVAGSNASLEKCHTLFDRAAASLDSLIGELQAILKQHRRSGSLRIYLRNSDLSRCKERFQRAQLILLTSQQAYFEIFAVQNFSLILKELHVISSNHRHLSLAPTTDAVAPEPVIRSIKTRDGINNTVRANQASLELIHSHRTPDTTVYHLKLPRWITHRAVQMLVQRSNASWGLTFRVYNRVGHDSAVWKSAQAGDWAQVEQLFVSRQASPFDINNWDQDLLSLAARQYNPKACRMLISNGLDPGRISEWGSTAVDLMALGSKRAAIAAKTNEVRETIALFAKFASDKFFSSTGHLIYGFLNSDAWLVRIVIQAVCSQDERIDSDTRVEMAFGGPPFDAARLKVLLGHNMTLDRAFGLAVSRKLAYTHLDLFDLISQSFGEVAPLDHYDQEWLEVLRSIVSFENNTCLRIRYSSTLWGFLCTYFRTNRWDPGDHDGGAYNQYVTEVARIWVALLKQAGANLERYVAAERLVCQKSLLVHSRRMLVRSVDRRGTPVILQIRYLLGGPEAEDWKIYVVPRSEKHQVYFDDQKPRVIVNGHDEYEAAGEFWTWIENPELFNIPGSYPIDTWSSGDGDDIRNDEVDEDEWRYTVIDRATGWLKWRGTLITSPIL